MREHIRKQLKEARKRMIDLDLSTGQIARSLGINPDMVSQMIHGHYYYPRYANEMYERYRILIPDPREQTLPKKAA